MNKKLYRSKTDHKLAGVCGGMGEYLGVDSSIIRVAWVFLALFFGVAILFYIICIFIIPMEDDYINGVFKERK